MEVHEVADFVDGSGDIMKKEEEGEGEGNVENTDKAARDGDDDDEGVQMKEGDDDLLEPSAAPNVGTDPRWRNVKLICMELECIPLIPFHRQVKLP